MKLSIIVIALIASTLFAYSQPKIVGHRGCRFNTKEAPATPNYENTLSALRFAQSLGIYAAEFDINLTSDDQIVVYHGPSVPGSEKKIQEMTFKEARKIVLPGGHRIPSLKEWFKQAKKDPSTKIIMEIKKHPKERETLVIEKAIALVKKMKMDKQIEYTTFSEWACDEIHRVDPQAKVLYLSSGKNVHNAQYLKEKKWEGMSYECKSFIENPQLVNDCKKLGIETTMWLVNNRKMLEWAIEHQVDYISSDHPEQIKALLNEILKK